MTRALILACTLLSVLALADLGARAAVRLEPRWDTFWYHLPFAARRGGVQIPYEMNDERVPFYQGFPPLPHLVQGLLWRLTGSVNATGVVNYLAFAAFLGYCHFVLGARAWLVSLIALTAPLVIIHTAVSYVDLFGNSLLAIGLSSCLFLHLFPTSERWRLVLSCGLCGLAGAAWSKYLLVPIVALGFVLMAAVTLRRRRAALLFVGILVAAAPYLKNWTVYGNPFWPLQVPVLSNAFPYLVPTSDRSSDRPPDLRDASQARTFVHSLLEIHHPRRYEERPRWIIDQGNAWIAFRAGGFWFVGVITYIALTAILLLTIHRKRGLIAAMVLAGLLAFVSILPQSNELRYYLFLPLLWAAAVGMQFSQFQEKAPRAAAGLLGIVIALFVYMVSENGAHYAIEKIDWIGAAQRTGTASWWGELEPNRKYCAVNMVPNAILMTGPTYSEYTIVDRSDSSLCAEGTVIVTVDGIQLSRPAPR